MRLTNKFKRIVFIIFQGFFLLTTVTRLFSQQRKDPEMPKLIGVIKSIANLTEWEKNDIDKWTDSRWETVLKIEISKISYEEKEHWCVAKFTKTFEVIHGVKKTFYTTFLWVFDLDKIQDLKYLDTSIQTKIYDNIIVSGVYVLSQPVTWKDLLIEIKKCFIGTGNDEIAVYDKFFMKYRYDYKLNKAQFYIGSLGETSKEDDIYEDFRGGNVLCTDKAKNKNMDCCYYEVNKNVFNKTFFDMLK